MGLELDLTLRAAGACLLSPRGVAVLAEGDSYTEGLRGDVGGWRAFITSPVQFVGPFTDPTGRRHGGRGGDRLENATQPDIIDRIVSDFAANPAVEVWLQGGTNDAVSDSQTSDQIATRLENVLNTLFAGIPSNVNVFVDSPPPGDAGTDSVLDVFGRLKISSKVGAQRSAGKRCYFNHCGGRLVSADLDNVPYEHPTQPGYQKWAGFKDEFRNPALALAPDQISDLAVWFEGDSYDAGTGQWSDKSGQGRHATPTGAPKPTLVTGAMGQLAANFASSPLRTSSGFTIAQPATHLVITDSLSATGSPAVIDAATTAARNLVQVASNGTMSCTAGTSVNDPDYLLTQVGHATMVEFNSPGGAATSKIFSDGNIRNVAINYGTQGMNGYTIGGSAAATPSNLLTAGRIYLICTWSRALTATERLGVFIWAALKYGIWPVTPGRLLSW